jgi:hypothetical protein
MPKLEVLHAPDPPSAADQPATAPTASAPPESADNRWRRQIRLLSCMFEIETDSPAVRDALDFYAVTAEQQVPIDYREDLTLTWTGDAFRLASGGAAEDFEIDLNTILESLHQRIQDRAVSALGDHGFIAAACGWHGAEHFLLLGAAGAGKTSLATRLMLDGFDLSGDAWVLLRDGQATAWPRQFQITEESVALLPHLAKIEQLRAIAAQPRAGYRVRLDPQHLGRPWRIRPAPVCAIFDLEPNFGARSTIRPCGKVDMVRRVMARSLAPAVQHDTWLAGLCAVVERAATYVVELGDLDSAAAAIADRLSRAGASQVTAGLESATCAEAVPR